MVASSISFLVVLIVIIAFIVAVSTTKKQHVATESVTTEVVTTEIVTTEIVTTEIDYTKSLIQGVSDGDLDTVKNILALNNDYINCKSNNSE